MSLACFIRELQYSFLKFPAIQCKPILRYIFQTDLLHFFIKHLPCGRLCIRTCSTITQDRIGFFFFHAFGKLIGPVCVNVGNTGIFNVQFLRLFPDIVR